MAGDDPTDVPFWDMPIRATLGGRVANVGPDRSAALVLNGGATAVTEGSFPVTTGEQLVFTADAQVLAGRARVILEFRNIGGSLITLRQFDIPSGSDWVTVGSETPFVVPAGSLYSRVVLESYTPDLAGGVGGAKQAALAVFDNVVVRNPPPAP